MAGLYIFTKYYICDWQSTAGQGWGMYIYKHIKLELQLADRLNKYILMISIYENSIIDLY